MARNPPRLFDRGQTISTNALTRCVDDLGEEMRSPREVDPLLRWLRRDGEQTMSAVRTFLIQAQPELGSEAALGDALDSHVALLDDFFASEGAAGPTRLGRHAEAWARQLASNGVAITSLVRSYETGHAEFWRRFATSLGARAPAARLQTATAALFRYMQLVTGFAITAYADTQQRRHGYRHAELVEGVLAGTIDETVAERALNYRFAPAHVGYVAWADDANALDDIVAALCDVLRPLQHVSSRVGERAVHGWFVARVGWERALRSFAWPAGVHVACGTAHAGRDGFCLTHREALEARRVADGLASLGFVAYGEVAAAALASRDSELAHAFVARELGALVDDQRLRETLDIWLAELGSATHTARVLGVHPNTITKRLARIEQLLGRSVSPANLSLRLALAVYPLLRR